MDLQSILSVDPDQLTESEKDDITQSITKEDLGKLTNLQEMKNAVNFLQSLLKFKQEQVASLGLELDELASTQGEREAQLIQEIEGLRGQLSKSSRKYSDGDGEDELRQLLHESELNAQKLVAEVQSQEQEHLVDKKEIEKLESQLASLESERLQLKRELSALREEIQEQHKDTESETQQPQKRSRELVESLRQKNKHLSLLLNDVEASEKENIVLKEKLTSVKIELAEATKSIMRTTGELVTLQITKEEQSEKVRILEQICEALQHQVAELVSVKEKRDTELETFQQEIDVRILEWKEIVASKEKALGDLREQLAHQNLKGQYVMRNSECEQIVLLSQTLQKRESQIDELQIQLAQATRDLNETTSLLENMHKSSELSSVGSCPRGVEVTQKQLLAAEERMKVLEEKLKDAENDAVGRSEEITKLIIQLRSYEAGEFGLTEALAQIKDLSQQKLIRDKHIEQLVETANVLRSTCDKFEEENLTLREQLNISSEEQIQMSAQVIKNKEKSVLKIKQEQIDRLEEDQISMRLDKRNLTQQILALSKQLQELQMNSEGFQKQSTKQNRSQADARATGRKIRGLQQQQHQLNIERQSLIEENEALRQGLHDILDSVHHQDGNSSVRLESKVLEHLLHALDSRHISGWYHPAMRIQAKVNTVEGNNEALREQLHCMREEESRTQHELQKAKIRIIELEGNTRETISGAQNEVLTKLDSPHNELHVISSVQNLQTALTPEGLDVVSKLNKHLLHVLHEHEAEKTHVAASLTIQIELQHELDALISQLGQIMQQQNLERERWQEEKILLEEQLDSAQAILAASEDQTNKLKALWDSLVAKEENKRDLVKDVFNFATLSAEKCKYERMAKAAQDRNNNAKRQLQLIKSEWNANKEWLIRQFGDHLQSKKTSLLRLSSLELMLMNSVPYESLKAANKQSDEVTSKYNELLRLHEMTVSKSDREMRKMMSELELAREAKDDLSRKVEDINKQIWSQSIGEEKSQQELSVQIAQAKGEALRESQHATHSEKMCEIIKAEMQQVSQRCQTLEEEVLGLLKDNHQLKVEVSSCQEKITFDSISGRNDDLQSQLKATKAEVLELQASQKHLQELADISQAQVQMLDQLHDRSELQLDALHQVLYKLQGETDLGYEIVRLSEELCTSQMNEMAAWNKISVLEKQYNESVYSREKQAKEIEELCKKIDADKERLVEYQRKMQEEIISLRMCSENTLPLSFYHLLATAFTQYSSESRNLWYQLQETKEKLVSQMSIAEEKKISCQQTIELQSALRADHSDLHCQRMMESWASELTQLKLENLKCSRHCEALESTLRQTQERLQTEEGLLSALEHQLLSLDMKRLHIHYTPERRVVQDNEDEGEATASHEAVPLSVDVLDPSQSPPLLLSEEPKTEIKEDAANESPKGHKDSNYGTEEQITSFKEQIIKLTEQLKTKECELESCRNICNTLKLSLHEKGKVQVTEDVSINTVIPETGSPKKDDRSCTEHEKAALQATVGSLQNIIAQKEDTICRYQRFLRDVREEDARIISALQEHLKIQQTNLSAQEQAYVRLKVAMRHLTLEASGEGSSKASFDIHLTRSNELEDEVALLNTKTAALFSELQKNQLEAAHWRSVSQKHLASIEELNLRLSEKKSSDRRPSFSSPYHETSTQILSKVNTMMTSDKNEEADQENCKGCRSIGELPRSKANQVHIQLRTEIKELRNKLHSMEEQEHQYKSEIQRLKDQLPIYSRRLHQSHCEPLVPEREAELLKKIKFVEQQLEQQKAEHEEVFLQKCQQELKKIKSAENVARWDERKKHQLQIEKLKTSLQEQIDETILLRNKVERMHNIVLRFEREKIALEHRIRNLLQIEQEKILLEERLKTAESNEVLQYELDELKKDRNSLFEEVQLLRATQIHDYKGITPKMFDELRQERDELLTEVKLLKIKDISADRERKVGVVYQTHAVQKERSDLLKTNLELECENLELKLELEKFRSETPGLRIKVTHLQRLVHELQTKQSSSANPQDPSNLECRSLQKKVRQLSAQLEVATQRLKTSESRTDQAKVAAMQTELHQKSLLLQKVKVLLERAADKERELSEQVFKLQTHISKG